LPQVAVFADAHFAVARAQVTLLDGDERIEELAAMLAGTATDAARESARELLARAASAKARLSTGAQR
jgi:DNA repair protein RecN (Recombination protein N)